MESGNIATKISFAWMLRKPYRILALGFGAGLIKPGPGTWGSFVGLLIWWLFDLLSLSLIWRFVIICVMFFVGVWICGQTSKDIGEHDSGSIVWDEIVAVLFLILCIAPQEYAFYFIAVIIFRIFDIWKPFPIAYFDRKLRSSFGIMFDDLLAAVYSFLTFKILILILILWIYK